MIIPSMQIVRFQTSFVLKNKVKYSDRVK
jgi:hypothetical protein